MVEKNEGYLTVVWQYNGEFAFCNYRCPYCYYDQETGVMKQAIFDDAEKWYRAFKENFPNRRIIFYLSFGEPILGRGFKKVMDMVASEPEWILHGTSNLSLPQRSWRKIVNHVLVKDKRFFINASFHPTETSIDEFLNKLLFLRQHGIECPVVIVMWPPLLKEFRKFFNIFNKHKFLVHVRRFNGWYNGKYYPRAYTQQEREFIARYADDATIKYMLNDHWDNIAKGKLSYMGVDYILVDENGDVWDSPDFKWLCLGNIFKRNVKLFEKPQLCKGAPCASVNGVASFVELGYEKLAPNMVISFAKQGGVHHTDEGVYYKNMWTDFNEPAIKKEYGFPNSFDKIMMILFTGIIDRVYRFVYAHSRQPTFYILSLVLNKYYHASPDRLNPEKKNSRVRRKSMFLNILMKLAIYLFREMIT